jgi:hypothetical protein
MLLAGPGGIAGSSTEGQYARMKETFADLQKNVKLLAFAARIEKEGNARLLTRVYFDPDGSYAKWVANAKALQGNFLAQFPAQDYLLAAFAHISPQTSFKGLVNLLWEDLPRDKAKQLRTEALQLVQRISEIGLTLYTAHAGDEKSPHHERLSGGVLVKVDDGPAFAKEVITLVKKSHQALQAAKRSGSKLKFQEKEIAGKPAWLITVTKKSQPKERDSNKQRSAEENHHVVLLTTLNPKTVLVASLEMASEAESAVKKFAKPPKRSLANNPGLKKTTALLPEERQVAVFLNVRPLLGMAGAFLGYADLHLTDCPPLAFALSTFSPGVEAQFVVPIGALQAVFEAARWEKNRKRPTKE